MKNRGFTLVELLAVIAVLGIIGLIAIPTVTSLINDSRQRARNTQIKEIVRSAQSWAAENVNKLPEDGVYYLSVQSLIDEGYINSEDVKDPTDSSKSLDQCVSITYSQKYSDYQFEYVDCPETLTG